MRLLIATLVLTACAPGTSAYPGLHCTGSINVEGEWSVAVEELWEKCGLMMNVKVKSWSGS